MVNKWSNDREMPPEENKLITVKYPHLNKVQQCVQKKSLNTSTEKQAFPELLKYNITITVK